MGSLILEKVLSELKKAGFAADRAYPGEKYPRITGPVAAVHLERVDSQTMTARVSVNILCPAAIGGTVCEEKALEAMEVLWRCGAVCSQQGCTYDRIAQVYGVAISADFTGQVREGAFRACPGFTVSINDFLRNYAVAFRGELVTDYQMEFATGEEAPVGTGTGPWRWSLRLEEQLPVGAKEDWDPPGTFSLALETPAKKEVYTDCLWTSVSREYTSQGLRCVRTGFALAREVVTNG